MDNDLINISGIFSALFLGLILGFKHSTDGDHVVAVSTMAKNFNNVFKSLWVGVSWGLGHSTPLLILGILILKVIDNGIILMSIPQEFQLVVPGVIIILAVYFDTLRKEKNG